MQTDEAVPIESAWIKNFRRVSDALYAGARPTPEGLDVLRDDYGIKTIVDLEPDEKPEYDEAKECGALGITLHSIPLPGLLILGTPPADKMAQIAAIVNDPEQRPLFVHCTHAAAATGVVRDNLVELQTTQIAIRRSILDPGGLVPATNFSLNDPKAGAIPAITAGALIQRRFPFRTIINPLNAALGSFGNSRVIVSTFLLTFRAAGLKEPRSNASKSASMS